MNVLFLHRRKIIFWLFDRSPLLKQSFHIMMISVMVVVVRMFLWWEVVVSDFLGRMRTNLWYRISYIANGMMSDTRYNSYIPQKRCYLSFRKVRERTLWDIVLVIYWGHDPGVSMGGSVLSVGLRIAKSVVSPVFEIRTRYRHESDSKFNVLHENAIVCKKRSNGAKDNRCQSFGVTNVTPIKFGVTLVTREFACAEWR